MNFDNGHRPRQGQHNNNNKRGRGRNNRRPGGGGGSHNNNNGGNSINRVYESNGPDVKVRGTAQTIAEKYMQLGRDAQSSGDNVMAESYFQFSEHYFRVMAAAQPVGQPTQQLRRPEDDDYDDEGEDNNEAEGEPTPVAADAQPGLNGEQPSMNDEPQARPPEQDRNNDQRNFRQRDGRDGQRDNSRDRFRPRWQNRRDERNDQPRDADAPEARVAENDALPQRAEEAPQMIRMEPNGALQNEPLVSGNWEAPSFLRRPAPQPVETVGVEDAPPEKRPRAPRRPRSPAIEETPQGE